MRLRISARRAPEVDAVVAGHGVTDGLLALILRKSENSSRFRPDASP
jgi:hypothetical protein